MADTVEQLRGLVLSATELREMTDWPDALIEDYLNLLNNFITLAEIIDVEVHQKLEEVPTDFADKTIPFVNDGFLIEDNPRFIWDFLTRTFTADGVHVSSGRQKGTTLVSTTPYNVLLYDEIIYVDTSGGDIDINLPAGIDGATYKIINTGPGTANITPDGTELLNGVNAAEFLIEAENLILTYNSSQGWY